MPGAATVKTEDEKNQKVMFLLKGVKKKKDNPKSRKKKWCLKTVSIMLSV